MEVAQPQEWNRTLWLTALGLLLLNFMIALIAPLVINRPDGTDSVVPTLFIVVTMGKLLLFGLPVIASVPGILLAFFLDRKQPFAKCVVRGWLMCLIVFYGFSAILTGVSVITSVRRLLLPLIEF